MIARLHIADGRIREAGFLPLYIDRDAVPRLVAPSDSRFGEVVEYLGAVTREADLNGRYTIGGDRVIVEAAS